MTPEHLEPAKSILARVGLENAARVTRKDLSRVYRWMYPPERGGTGGLIPQKHHRALLDYARSKRIDLAAEDFLPARRPSRRVGAAA